LDWTQIITIYKGPQHIGYGCHLWSRNCLPFRSTWILPGS